MRAGGFATFDYQVISNTSIFEKAQRLGDSRFRIENPDARRAMRLICLWLEIWRI